MRPRISVAKQKEIERKLRKKVSDEPITSFDCCPHCGDTFGYYFKTIVEGIVINTTCFDHQTKENSEMYDSLRDVWAGSYYFCAQCDQAICRRDETEEADRLFINPKNYV